MQGWKKFHSVEGNTCISMNAFEIDAFSFYSDCRCRILFKWEKPLVGWLTLEIILNPFPEEEVSLSWLKLPVGSWSKRLELSGTAKSILTPFTYISPALPSINCQYHNERTNILQVPATAGQSTSAGHSVGTDCSRLSARTSYNTGIAYDRLFWQRWLKWQSRLVPALTRSGYRWFLHLSRCRQNSRL